jgi:uncharacterized protein GlcG (DUF336 family)
MRGFFRPLAALLALCGAAASAQAQQASLTAAEVNRIVSQAAAEAQRVGLSAHIAVTDQFGNLLGLFRMNGAPCATVINPSDPPVRPLGGTLGQGLERIAVATELVAISKAGSGAFLSSGSSVVGNAFSTRTASFIVQEHFPPNIDFTAGGPLFGVQFSSLICTDFKRIGERVPLGLSGDPGGLPIYKNGVLVGGIGVEGDGGYGQDSDPTSLDDPGDAVREEQAALAGTRGFEVPELIRANRILADGIRFTYVNVQMPSSGGASLPGQYAFGPRDGLADKNQPTTQGGVTGQRDPRFPTRGSSLPGANRLTAADVDRILSQAAQQTTRTRAAIRQPLGSNTRVSITVVDTDGSVLGFFQNAEAPNFGIDVSAQKARTANFFSSPGAGDILRAAGLGRYIRDGIPLDGSVAFTSRAVGFLAQPLYPPGIENTQEGPFSRPFPNEEWSIFNTGLQVDLIAPTIKAILASIPPVCSFNPAALLAAGDNGLPRCAAGLPQPIPQLPNGITIFPGGVPLYKNGALVGAIGISGDGVDQDDLISWAGSIGFEAPVERRCDQLVIRDTRLPYVKFPRHPEL